MTATVGTKGRPMTFDFIKAQRVGPIVADYVAPLAVWLIVLWFLAAIVLLVGTEAG